MNAPQHDADAIKVYWENAAKQSVVVPAPAPLERHEYTELEPVPVARRPVGRTFVRIVGTLILLGGIIAAFGPFEYRLPFEGKFADGYAANRADELVYLARVAVAIVIGFGLLIIANMPQNPE